jgi:hypothetical protein
VTLRDLAYLGRWYLIALALGWVLLLPQTAQPIELDWSPPIVGAAP